MGRKTSYVAAFSAAASTVRCAGKCSVPVPGRGRGAGPMSVPGETTGRLLSAKSSNNPIWPLYRPGNR